LNDLGTALAALGERESGIARLNEAVAAFREALQEYTRERVPLDWAMTNALAMLGKRASSTAQLKKAIAAFDACISVTAPIWPSEWVNHVRANRDKTLVEIDRRRAK
jgi:hypothetical protein